MEKTGAKWTGTTISQQQYNYAKEIIEQGNWEDRATLLQEDYRNLQGSYDRIVSIEMIEEWGMNIYPPIFQKFLNCSPPMVPHSYRQSPCRTTVTTST